MSGEDRRLEEELTLTQALRAANVGLWTRDLRQHTVYFSPEWKSQLGYSDEELPNRVEEWEQRLHPEDRERVLAEVRRFLADPWPGFEVESRLRHRDGSYRWFLTRADVERDDEGRPIRLLGCHIDVTARRRAETDLRRLVEAVRASGVGPWSVNLRDGSAFHSREWKALLGFEEDEIGDDQAAFFERLHPEDRTRVEEHLAGFLAAEPVASEVEFRLRTADGSYRWFQTRGRVARAEDGEPEHVHGVLIDVCEARAMETKLRESEAKFRAMADMSPVGILLSDANGTLTYGNAAARRLAGVPLEDPRAGRWVKAIHPEDRERVVAGWLEAIRRREPWEGSGRYLHDDGTLAWWRVTTAPVEVEGRMIGHVGVLEDITEQQQRTHALEDAVRQRTEELAERIQEVEQLNRGMLGLMQDLEATNQMLAAANRELEAFTSSVSHDLRTPLRAILGFAELLEKRCGDGLDEKGRRYLENVSKAAAQMVALIHDLLAYARLGRGELRRESTELSEVIDEVLVELESRIAEEGAQVTVGADLPAVVGDRTLLRQIAANLMENALTYHAPGAPPEVVVEAGREGGEVILSVRDSGIGVPEEDRERIFRVFERLHGEAAYPGTGIGLALVRKSAELLGGRAWIEPGLPTGSVFRVALPAPPD